MASGGKTKPGNRRVKRLREVGMRLSILSTRVPRVNRVSLDQYAHVVGLLQNEPVAVRDRGREANQRVLFGVTFTGA